MGELSFSGKTMQKPLVMLQAGFRSIHSRCNIRLDCLRFNYLDLGGSDYVTLLPPLHGIAGLAMARNLLKAGYEVHVCECRFGVSNVYN